MSDTPITKLRLIFRLSILGIFVFWMLGCSLWDNNNSSRRVLTLPESTSRKHGQEDSPLLLPVDLSIEKNSTLFKNIARIWHEPMERRVCVQMRRNAKCPHPALLGRLSGPSLALLEWKDLDYKFFGNVLCGSYEDQWLDAGEYFIEIIALYCEDFGYQVLQRKSYRKLMDNWFDEDYLKSKCVQNADNNRITGTDSRITLSMPQRGAGSFRIGRWERRPGLPSQPLYTRYQPAGCVKEIGHGIRPLDPLPEWCPSITDRDISDDTNGTYKGLPEYEFHWGVNTTETEITNNLQQTYRDHKKKVPKICVVGDSHARFIVNRSVKYLGVRGIMTYVKHQWPSASTIAEKIVFRKCEIVVILVGQWPAAFNSGGHPFAFGKYYAEMKMLVQTVTSTLSNVTNPKVYLPTVDMGPLMGAINLCRDWRTPTVMSSYSYMLQLIAFEESRKKKKKSNVNYIDTSFIIQSHWDGDRDWLHLPEDVRYHKTIYILARILDDIGYNFCDECLP